MYKHKLIAVSIILSSALIPCISSAESTAPSTSPSTTTATPATPAKTTTPTTPADSSEMSKTQWLEAIVPMLPSLICKGFLNDPELKQRLDAVKMDYDQCVKAIPESVSKCQSQIGPNIPEKITNEAASTWGKTLGECIGKDFAMKYLMPK